MAATRERASAHHQTNRSGLSFARRRTPPRSFRDSRNENAEAKAVWIESLKAQSATFRPYIHVEGEPSVPSVLELPIDEQLAALPPLMQAYLRKYNGACPFFGKVTGFRFVRCLDFFRFDEDGQFIERIEEPFRRGEASVSLK